MQAIREERSIGQLLKELRDETTTLLRQEVDSLHVAGAAMWESLGNAASTHPSRTIRVELCPGDARAEPGVRRSVRCKWRYRR